MKRQRIIAAIVAISSFLIFFILVKALNPPKGYQIVEGPSTDVLTTSGILKPGGYVDFVYSPGIKSIKGLYKCTIITNAMSADHPNLNDTLWPYSRQDVGKDWGDSLPRGEQKTFTIQHRVEIPNDEMLAGTQIIFNIEYFLFYPTQSSYGEFRQENETLVEEIAVEISDIPPTAQELSWSQARKPGGFTGFLGGVLMLVGFVSAVIAIFLPRDKSKS